MRIDIHHYNHADAGTRILLSNILKEHRKIMATQAKYDEVLHGLTDNISALKLALAQDRADLVILTQAIKDFMAKAPADLDISGLEAAVADVGTIKPDADAMDAEIKADTEAIAPAAPATPAVAAPVETFTGTDSPTEPVA